MSRIIMAGLKTSQTGASNCENLVNASIVWSLCHIMCIIWHKPYSNIICATWAHNFGNDSHVRGCWISWWLPLIWKHFGNRSEIKRVLDWHHISKKCMAVVLVVSVSKMCWIEYFLGDNFWKFWNRNSGLITSAAALEMKSIVETTSTPQNKR